MNTMIHKIAHKTNQRSLLRRLRQTDGAEIAEAALVLPLVFTLLLGIVWFGRAFNIYCTITQAAQQGAIAAARATCATCGSPPGSFSAAITTAVSQAQSVMQSSSLDTTQILANPNPAAPIFCANPPLLPPIGATGCSSTNNIKVCQNVLLNPPASTTQLPQCGSVVSFEYPFSFYLPFTSLNLRQINLAAQAQSRMEN